MEEADLPQSKDLLTIEDMSEGALPPSIDASTHPNQAEKNQQIGISAAKNFLKAMISKEQNDKSGGVRSSTLVVDLSVHTCDFSRAITAEPGVYYVGLARDLGEEEWARTYMKDFLATNFLNGEIKLPSKLTLPAAEVPSDLQAAAPPFPALTTLVVNKAAKIDGLQTLKTPDKLLAQWGEHHRFGPDFWQVIKEARASMPLDLAPDSKRQADGHGNAPPVKRLKTGEKDEDDKSGAGGVPVKREDKEIIVKQLSELPTPLTWEAALPLPKAKGQCSLVVTLGSRVWLVNRTENQVVLNKHFIIAGFYKGKWWQKVGSQDEVKEQDIMYQLQNASTLVVVNGKVMSLGQAVKEKRQTQPDAVIQYHAIKDHPIADDPGWFVCEREKTILFQVLELPAKNTSKTEDGKAVISHDKIAGCIPIHMWNGPFSELVWITKWSATEAKGLAPFRPTIILTQDVVLPKQSIMELTGETAVPPA